MGYDGPTNSSPSTLKRIVEKERYKRSERKERR